MLLFETGPTSRRHSSRGLEVGTRTAHLLVRLVTADARHGTRAVRDDDGIEAVTPSIEHGRANTHVLRQPADPDTLHTSRAELVRQARFVEGRILIAIEAHTLG